MPPKTKPWQDVTFTPREKAEVSGGINHRLIEVYFRRMHLTLLLSVDEAEGLARDMLKVLGDPSWPAKAKAAS